MNILHLYKAALPHSMGGVEQVIQQLAKGAVEKGAKVDVLAFHAGPQEVIDFQGYKVHYLPIQVEIASTPFSLKTFSKFRELAKQADIIHYHYPYPFADLLHLIYCRSKPAILTYHSDIIRQRRLLWLYKPLQKLFLNSVKQIVATSPNYLETSKTLQKYSDKVAVIPLGLNNYSDVEIPLERAEYWRHKVGNKFFLFTGVLRYYKGLQFLLDALRETDYPTVILGSGPEEKILQQQAKKNGLKNTHFVGQVSEVDKTTLLKLCYAFVFPSHLRSEAFGVSLIEAAMFGKPMVTCEIGTGTSYVNIHKQTGLVVHPDNTSELQEAMFNLWSTPKMVKILGKNARKRYEKLFKTANMVQIYMDLYNQVV